MLKFVDKLPWVMLIVGTIFLGSAPFVPEPHLVEKLRMLFEGSLSRPMDIFDLFLHASMPTLLIIKTSRHFLNKA
ncbi:MAG: RND transporter [Gammaproteobacteria bacterium]|nr:RND transporter [Gammaproteobacteria bacterium]